MSRSRKITIFTAIFFIFIFSFSTLSFAVSCDESCDGKNETEKPTCLAEVKSACEAKLNETNAKKQTLQSAINYLDSKIGLTQSQINETTFQIGKLEKEIKNLQGTISSLDLNLDQISKLLSQKVKRSYKNSRINPVYLFFGSSGFSDFISRYKYLSIAQAHDRNSIVELEIARDNYDKQKISKVKIQTQVLGLQTELLGQKQNMDYQQREKEQLLVLTKHEESRYQDLLEKANAELVAIQAIIAGRGSETEVGGISQGKQIATVIPSSSACSSGGHLHFEVAKDKINQNPFNYLSSKSLTWDNLDSPKNGSGSWPWPVNDPIRITQDYGMTYYAINWNLYNGKPHTGVDMVNKSNYAVTSVQPGVLYRGSIACGGGTLQYVRVEQSDGISTYYLHVNYF